MLQNLREYKRPNDVEEAWALYTEEPGHTLFSTGGLSTALREDRGTQRLIDISGVLPSGLEKRNKSDPDAYDRTVIGGAMTINEAIRALDGHFLTPMLKQVGSNQIRNMATVSGSVAQKYGWSDILTALLAAKAKLEIYNGKYREMALEHYLRNREKAIVLSVIVPDRFNTGSFQTMTRTHYDVSQFNLFLAARVENETIHSAGLACGARPAAAVELKATEQLIRGSYEDLHSKMEEITKTAVGEAGLGNGNDLSREYREELLAVYLKQAIEMVTGH